MTALKDRHPIKVTQETVTIASGETTSTVLELRGLSLVAIRTPGSLTGTTMTILVSVDGLSYKSLDNTSGAIDPIVIRANKHIGIPPSDGSSILFLKLVSNATEAADREFEVVMRLVD